MVSGSLRSLHLPVRRPCKSCCMIQSSAKAKAPCASPKSPATLDTPLKRHKLGSDGTSDPEAAHAVATSVENRSQVSIPRAERKWPHSATVLTAAAVARSATSSAQVSADTSEIRVAYQGMPGAYSEMAARKAYPKGEPLPCEQFETAFQILSQWMADRAVLPIENTLGGSNHAIYDLLMRYQLHIVGETWMEVEHCLVALPGVQRSEITRVMSHPHALAQCDAYLQKLPGVTRQAVSDTALAASTIARKGLRQAAALASAAAAEKYGLIVLEKGVQDSHPNVTRFIVLSRDALALTAADNRPYKTSIVFSLPCDGTSGQLFKALSVFAIRDIDLSKIESRPLRSEPLSLQQRQGLRNFQYLFYVDLLINVAEERAQNALRHLQEFAPFMRVLGSFPREDIPETLRNASPAAVGNELELGANSPLPEQPFQLPADVATLRPSDDLGGIAGSNGTSQPLSSVPSVPLGGSAEPAVMRVAYQGVPGAYSEMAARQACPEAEPTPCEQFEVAFQALDQALVDKAVLPIENSLGGSIHAVYDLLIRYRLHIVGEATRDINHCLLALPGIQRSQIRRVISHWQALAQVDGYLRALPGVVREAVDDTAGAAQLIAAQQLMDVAAVASSRAAEIYGLQVLEEGIQDNRDNVTRFLVLSRDPLVSGQGDLRPFKTSIVFSMPERAGQLFKALSVFALRDIDMTKIESRPLRSNPMVLDINSDKRGKRINYLFHIDFVANLADKKGQNALRQLQEIATYMRVLGCYPMYTGQQMTSAPPEPKMP